MTPFGFMGFRVDTMTLITQVKLELAVFSLGIYFLYLTIPRNQRSPREEVGSRT